LTLLTLPLAFRSTRLTFFTPPLAIRSPSLTFGSQTKILLIFLPINFFIKYIYKCNCKNSIGKFTTKKIQFLKNTEKIIA
jgi:hypothetical protein